MPNRLLPRVLADGVAELRKSFDVWWPCEGNNEAPEATTLLAVAHALRDYGFRTFSQVQVRGRRSEHVDLVAISPRRRLAVLIEGKRLYHHGGARSLAMDWSRLADVDLAIEHQRMPPGLRVGRAVIATTWTPSVAAWWDDFATRTARMRGAGWDLSERVLADALRGRLVVQSDNAGTAQHLLYAVSDRRPFMQ